MKSLFISLFGLGLTVCVSAQTGVAKANNISIAYESFGKITDPPIILIQGTGAPMINWLDGFCQKLAARGYRVIRFDNRDIGLSSRLDFLGQPDWGADLAKLKIPALVIHGDKDPLVPLEAGREVANTIPGARFIIIQGMGHDGYLEFTDKIVDAIAKHTGK